MDVEYSLVSVAQRTYRDGLPYPSRARAHPDTTSVSFSTSSPGKSDWGVAEQRDVVLCRTKGELEREILSMAE